MTCYRHKKWSSIIRSWPSRDRRSLFAPFVERFDGNWEQNWSVEGSRKLSISINSATSDTKFVRFYCSFPKGSRTWRSWNFWKRLELVGHVPNTYYNTFVCLTSCWRHVSAAAETFVEFTKLDKTHVAFFILWTTLETRLSWAGKVPN